MENLKSKLIRELRQKKRLTAVQAAARYGVTEPHVRKIMHEIRVEKHLRYIIADRSGYYLTTSKQKINNYVGTLQSRKNQITEIIKSLS